MNNDTTIGQNVRKYRRDANVTQEALGRHLDVCGNAVAHYEKGINRIAAGRIPIIAAFLGCTLEDLFEGTEDKV